MSLRASAAQGPGAGFSTETSGPQLLLPPSSLTLSQGTRLGDGVRAGVGFGGGDGKVGDPEVSGHSLINSLDLACPGVSGYTGQTAGGGADDTATSGSLKRHPGGDGHRYSSGMERRVRVETNLQTAGAQSGTDTIRPTSYAHAELDMSSYTTML
jgi:hypothetical protein